MPPSASAPPAATPAAGFTVLELLVAIAILAAALVPLLTLQQSNTRAALAVERAQARLAADRQALAYLRGVNPARRQSGETALGEARMTWRGEPVGAARPVRTTDGQSSRFDLQRYRVTVRITGPDRPAREWAVTLLGWRPRRPFSTQFE